MKKKFFVTKPDFFSTQVVKSWCFYLNLKPSPKEKLVVVCGGVEHCASDYAIRRLSFPFYSIEFVAQGKGSLKLNGVEHVLQAGSIFSYGPKIRHEISTNAYAPLVKYFVDFSGSYVPRLMKLSQIELGSMSRIYPPTEIQPLFDEIIRNGLRNTAWSSQICVQLLETLLLKITDARAPLPGQDTLAFSTYQQCRNHIEVNFLRLRSLQQIALESHTNSAYLCRLFQRFDHQTPYRLLIRLKMNHAAELLRSSGAMVKQIAEETGFSNPFHFSKVFKSEFGLSPKAFIEIH